MYFNCSWPFYWKTRYSRITLNRKDLSGETIILKVNYHQSQKFQNRRQEIHSWLGVPPLNRLPGEVNGLQAHGTAIYSSMTSRLSPSISARCSLTLSEFGCTSPSVSASGSDSTKACYEKALAHHQMAHVTKGLLCWKDLLPVLTWRSSWQLGPQAAPLSVSGRLDYRSNVDNFFANCFEFQLNDKIVLDCALKVLIFVITYAKTES